VYSLLAAVGAPVIVGACVGLAVKSYRYSATPTLKLSTQYLDLGEGKPKERMKGEFTITNSGRRPLVFAINASCGCTSLDPRNGTLVAGGSQKIEIAVVLPENTGTQRNSQVAITSNDPTSPTSILNAAARCPSPLTG
jgi:hypothetical protein